MRKKIIISLLFLTLALIGAFLFYPDRTGRNSKNRQETILLPANQLAEVSDAIQPTKEVEQKNIPEFNSPLGQAKERVTKKPFGILINPKTSPVQPERFSGYHTGTDFEIFPEELDADVVVRSVCAGKVRSVKYINGYGGVVIQDCNLNGESITVLYGHLKLASVSLKIGDNLDTGSTIGILGKAYSAETSGERKHLHLSFRRGTAINFKGYVQNKNDLVNWIDPCLYVCK